MKRILFPLIVALVLILTGCDVLDEQTSDDQAETTNDPSPSQATEPSQDEEQADGDATEASLRVGSEQGGVEVDGDEEAVRVGSDRGGVEVDERDGTVRIGSDRGGLQVDLNRANLDALANLDGVAIEGTYDSCSQGGCETVCEEGETCRASCSGGDCRQVCEAGATCTFSCSGGGCERDCHDDAHCTTSCSGGDCTD